MDKNSIMLLAFAAICVIAGKFEAHADPLADAARKECQSPIENIRLSGCTKIINAGGFGSNKKLADALDGRCWALHAKGMYQEAIQDCKAALSIQPNHAYALNNLGTAQLGLRGFAEAIKSFSAAMTINPRFQRPYVNRAKAYVEAGRSELAQRDLEAVLQINGKNGEALAALQSLQAEQLRLRDNKVVQPVPKVLEAPPDFSWTYVSTRTQPKASGKRRVILIENDDYKFVGKLVGPKNDVEAASSVFKEMGFDTVILRNPKKPEIVKAISEASFKSERGSLIVLYYSGHAAQINGENTIILTGFNPTNGLDSENSLTLRTVLDSLAATDFEKTLVAFDACRNEVKLAAASAQEKSSNGNADIIRSVRGMTISASEIQALRRKEYSILFSTSAGEFAQDTLESGLSPFTKAFTTALRSEKSLISAMVLTKRITEEVTSNEQSPTIEIKWNSDLTLSRSVLSSNSARYELLEPLKYRAADQALKSGLLALTEELWQGGERRATLVFTEKQMEYCRGPEAFIWSSSPALIGFCAFPQIGLKREGQQALTFVSADSVYGSGSYDNAEWRVDLDFDGKPETLRVERRNADSAFIVKSQTQEVEFRGLVGPNIGFVGLHDFNKDGVLSSSGVGRLVGLG